MNLKNELIKKVIIILVVVFYLSFRIFSLGTDISHTDEARWHIRSQKFSVALKEKHFANTYQHNQPGVILMWVGTIYNYIFYPKFSVDTQDLIDVDTYITVHKESRMLLVMVLSLIFLIQLLCIKNLFGLKTMFYYGLIVSTEPYLVGVDRLFHVTSLETYLLFTSFLFLYSWFEKNEKISLFMSALFFALSLLTKTTSIIILPLYVYMFYLKFKNTKNLDAFIFLITAFATYIVLFPAISVNTSEILSRLYSGIHNGISKDTRTIFYNGFLFFLYYPLLFAFKVSLTTLFLTVFFAFNFKKSIEFKNSKFVIIYFILFYVAFSLSSKKIDRYLISLLPPILLYVAININKLKPNVQKTATTLIVIVSIVISYIYHPVYLAYYSPFLLNSKGASKFGIYTHGGQYFSNAALYLNEIGENKKIAVPYNDISFYYFYNHKQSMTQGIKKDTDYIVLSFIKLGNIAIPERCKELEKTFGSRLEKDIVLIYKCKKPTQR